MIRKPRLRLKVAALFFVSAMILTIVAAYANEKKAEETTPVKETNAIVDPIKTDSGLISGMVLGDAGKGVRAYRGIPYAAPPVGVLRWKPPQPVQPWTGVRECTAFSAVSPQTARPGQILPKMSEDCLYLNVVTPAKKTSDRLPVMVWFHGGGLAEDSGNRERFNREYLAQKGVVTVAVTHRLGALGYMAHPLLSRESEHGVSGNYGTLDLIAALKWVQKNIAAFGGDPDRVTIFGESGGGVKTTAMMASPLAKGLFQRAIIQSGSYQFLPDASRPLKNAETLGEKMAVALGVDKDADVLASMRMKSWNEILEAGNKDTELDGMSLADLTVDGWVLPDQVYNIFQSGKQNDASLIIGASKSENAMFKDISIGASSTNKGNSKAYVYVFNHMPSNWKKEGAIPPHGMFMIYAFRDIDGLKPFFSDMAFLMNGFRTPGSPDLIVPKNSDPGITDTDYKVSDAIMTMWTKFAATGNPSIEDLVSWPAYDSRNPQCLEIKEPLEVKPWNESAFK